MMGVRKMSLTEEELKIRAWGENQNEMVRDEIRNSELPTIQEILNEVE